MTDFLEGLVSRSFRLMPALEPRRPSRFEMPSGQSPLEVHAMPENSRDTHKRGVDTVSLSEQNESPARRASKRRALPVEGIIASAHRIPPDAGLRMSRPLDGYARRELRGPEEATVTRAEPRQVPVANVEQKQSAHTNSSHTNASERNPVIKAPTDSHDISRRAAEQPGSAKHEPRQEETKAVWMEPSPRETGIKSDPPENSRVSSAFKMSPARKDEAEVRRQDVHSTIVETASSYDVGPPIVRVTIGRVEVRAVMSSPPVATKSEEPRAVKPLSLDEYLRRRGHG